MTNEGEEESYEALADHRLGRSGLQVKLDRGFENGTYAVYIEFEELAARVGFAAARRTAAKYCALLREQLGRSAAACTLGEIEDSSRSGAPHRRRDLEMTFLSFPVETADGRYHDATPKEQFRVGFIRAGQAWDQSEARAQTNRRLTREGTFRRRLAELLSGLVYAGVDVTTRERLLDEVTALAFPPRGIGL